jgi:hypothetical protein
MTVFSLFGAPEPLSSLLSGAQSPRDVGYSADSRDTGTSVMDQHEDLQELLTRLRNIPATLWKRRWAMSGVSRTTTGVGYSKLTSRALYVR